MSNSDDSTSPTSVPIPAVQETSRKTAPKKSKAPYTYERALGYALWLLGRRPYSIHEITTKLERKETPPEVIQRVIHRLKDLHLLDDAAYAHRLVATKKRHKGPLALKQALRKKGFTEDVIAESLEDEIDTPQQYQAAMVLLEKHRWRFEKKVDMRDRKRKAYAFLARRGFTPDIVGEALAEFFSTTASEDDIDY